MLNIFKKEMALIAGVFSKIALRRTWLSKYLKSPVSGDPSTSNMVRGPNTVDR